MPAAPPGRAWLEGLVGCRDLGTVTVAAAVCPLAGGVLPVPTAQGPAPPGASIRWHRGDGGPQKSRLVVEALKPAPAWGRRFRCVVGDASQEREGMRAKECVGGPRPWKRIQHGDGLGLIPHGASTPPAMQHGPPPGWHRRHRQPPGAGGLLGRPPPCRATWSRGWKRCQVSALASAPLRGTPGHCDKNSPAGSEPGQAGLQPGVVPPGAPIKGRGQLSGARCGACRHQCCRHAGGQPGGAGAGRDGRAGGAAAGAGGFPGGRGGAAGAGTAAGAAPGAGAPGAGGRAPGAAGRAGTPGPPP